MGDEKAWRLWIDGEERTDDCDHIDVATPALVYDVPHDGRWKRSVLGPRGFSILVTNPSVRLVALADDGKEVHAVRVAASDNSMSVPVQFHMEWVERSGVRKMFGCLAANRDSEPKWVTEPGVSAGERREEGGQ
jgi:hypothetical protein